MISMIPKAQKNRRFPALPDWFSVALVSIAIVVFATTGHPTPTPHPVLNADATTEPIPLPAGKESPDADILTSVAAMLRLEEGFRKFVYKDTAEIDTIGYGTSLKNGITVVEGDLLLNERLKLAWDDLNNTWPKVKDQPDHVKMALLDMSYQLGVDKLLEFHDMFDALETGDYAGAKAAGLDSLWAEKTPKRAHRVLDELAENPGR